MGTIVDARVPTGQFALAETFEDVPDASLEAVHIVASRADRQLPFFWGTATDLGSLDAALAADDSTKSTTRLVRDEDRVLYRIEWCSAVRMFVYVLVEERGTILDLAVHADAWQFRILFPDKDAMSRFYDFCKDHDVDIDISRVNGLSTVVEHGGTRLSTAQYEALSEALAADYYNVPRGTTLVELSERLGVSHQAVSERLRRGHYALIESTLHDGMAPGVSLS
jgi:predicted DNA binding protein